MPKDKDIGEASGIPWPLPMVLSPEQAFRISRALLVDVTAPETPPGPTPDPTSTVINVQPAPVTVQAATAPNVTVQPAPVTVQSAQPVINVQPAEVTMHQAPAPPIKLRFLHVRDGYVSYDHITSVKVHAPAAQPIQIIVTTSEGAMHLWTETYTDRAKADLALDRIVWAISL